MERQRGGDGEIEELSGHCLFCSYMSLAPSVGSDPQQQRLQSSPNSPVTIQKDAERERRARETQMKGESENAKPYILHVHALVKPQGCSSCPYLTWVYSVGLVSPSLRGLRWQRQLYRRFLCTACVRTGRTLFALRDKCLCSLALVMQHLEMKCNNWFARQNKTTVEVSASSRLKLSVTEIIFEPYVCVRVCVWVLNWMHEQAAKQFFYLVNWIINS